MNTRTFKGKPQRSHNDTHNITSSTSPGSVKLRISLHPSSHVSLKHTNIIHSRLHTRQSYNFHPVQIHSLSLLANYPSIQRTNLSQSRETFPPMFSIQCHTLLTYIQAQTHAQSPKSLSHYLSYTCKAKLLHLPTKGKILLHTHTQIINQLQH